MILQLSHFLSFPQRSYLFLRFAFLGTCYPSHSSCSYPLPDVLFISSCHLLFFIPSLAILCLSCSNAVFLSFAFLYFPFLSLPSFFSYLLPSFLSLTFLPDLFISFTFLLFPNISLLPFCFYILSRTFLLLSFTLIFFQRFFFPLPNTNTPFFLMFSDSPFHTLFISPWPSLANANVPFCLVDFLSFLPVPSSSAHANAKPILLFLSSSSRPFLNHLPILTYSFLHYLLSITDLTSLLETLCQHTIQCT